MFESSNYGRAAAAYESIHVFINAIVWVWIFLLPVAAFVIVGWMLYERSNNKLIYSIIIGIAGISAGIFLAEWVRRRFGLARI